MGLDMYLSTVSKKVNPQELLKKMRYRENLTEEEKKVAREACEIFYEAEEDVGYWRKANAIHHWFVEHIQEGEDDCGRYEVSKEQLQNLLDTVNMVMDNPTDCDTELPSHSGFFYGSVSYDQWYFQSLVNTRDILERVLKETNFDEEVVYYSSSW